VPVFGATFGALLLGEAVLPSMVVGGLIALAGVSLTNWSGPAATPRAGTRPP
jgi:drug/metabolite transporter (DMT)-like permease